MDDTKLIRDTTLAGLQLEMKAHEMQMEQIKMAMAALKIGGTTSDAVVQHSAVVQGVRSARMGILEVLKANPEPMQPKQIVSILEQKGFAFGKNPRALAQNVGAVLSVMLNKRKEVKHGPRGEGYLISAAGLKALDSQEVA